MSGAYAFQLLGKILGAKRGTLWVVTTNPFFAPGLAACAARLRGQRVVHYVFDLYPDALEAAGALRVGGAGSRLIAAWTRFTQRVSAGAVYLGGELKRHTEERYGKARYAAVIPVAADEREFLPAKLEVLPAVPLRLHYGGQLGAMHDAAGLAEGVAALAVERAAGAVAFDFMAGGVGVRRLESLAGGAGVTLRGTVASPVWREEAARHQVGLVALTPAGMHVCLPSKVYAMMAAGMAIIAICPERSDLAALMRETGAGWVVDNTNASALETGQGFADVVRELMAKPETVREARRCARHAAETRYGHQEISRAWGRFILKLETRT